MICDYLPFQQRRIPFHRANKINLLKPSYWVSGPSGDNGTLITMKEEEYEVG
jgi:hypothetical protein